MKIEKINDNQIRCTLTPDDLKARDIRISELTYSSGKARSLFQDMMKEAYRNYGFRVDNTPLMIEAMPDSGGNLTLVITKVKDPEEIDSRFAHFTSEPQADDYNFSNLAKDLEGADSVLRDMQSLLKGDDKDKKDGAGSTGISIVHRNGNAKNPVAGFLSGLAEAVSGSAGAAASTNASGASESASSGSDRRTQLNTLTEEELFGYTRFYMFHTLESAIRAAKEIGPGYQASNTLFKNPDDGEFYLLIRKEDTDPERFNQICNVLSEYGLPMDFANGTSEFFHEHMKVISTGSAVQTLCSL